MKIIMVGRLILFIFLQAILLLALALSNAAPIDQDANIKAKRGLHLDVGYHAPLVTHSALVAPAATVVHHEPTLLTHGSLLAHAPVYTTHHVLPTYAHTLHHY
uniref:Uncharacterized protein n=1 Tax=Glossina morsitans morsitans TaxID=37546 RepID=A0A1B0FKJ0_GLOMM